MRRELAPTALNPTALDIKNAGPVAFGPVVCFHVACWQSHFVALADLDGHIINTNRGRIGGSDWP